MMIPDDSWTAPGGGVEVNMFQTTDTEFDPFGMYNTDEDGNPRFTIPKSGVWYVICETAVALPEMDGEDAIVRLQIHRNGGPQWIRDRTFAAPDDENESLMLPPIHLPRKLDEGDHIAASAFSHHEADPANGPDLEFSGSPTETLLALLWLGQD
ncbi:hypothetical protein [Natronoglomus mannanivorans]|uniref:Uncharacterized protein n=1 Tax=Natronoglomus mannanivorans TaxID=2979990 RepID=A0AAP2Z2U1_9EURY|nr:hypothetical protein [Halobacteria archaeon AArc-xg1-1]